MRIKAGIEPQYRVMSATRNELQFVKMFNTFSAEPLWVIMN